MAEGLGRGEALVLEDESEVMAAEGVCTEIVV